METSNRFGMNAGEQVKRFDVRREAVQKIGTKAFGLGFVEPVARLKVHLRRRQDVDFEHKT